MERIILTLLAERARGASICPSEAARRADPEHWRTRMKDVRRAGRRLAARGTIEFTRAGRVVDPADAKGPVRFRLTPGTHRSGRGDPHPPPE